MVKRQGTLLFILAFLLVACQSALVSPTAPPATQAAPEQVLEDAASPEPSQLPEVAATSTTEQALDLEEANCTVVSRQPTPGPTEQSIVPGVSDMDWALGPEDARVTIIEYGDFQ